LAPVVTGRSHVNLNESATNTSPHPFWTKCSFDPVNETLVVTPLTATEDANPLLRKQQALNALAQAEVKTLEQTEVLAGDKEYRDHFSINPKDGLKTDNDKGMVWLKRRARRKKHQRLEKSHQKVKRSHQITTKRQKVKTSHQITTKRNARPLQNRHKMRHKGRRRSSNTNIASKKPQWRPRPMSNKPHVLRP
jgi:hypothetical protein